MNIQVRSVDILIAIGLELHGMSAVLKIEIKRYIYKSLKQFMEC